MSGHSGDWVHLSGAVEVAAVVAAVVAVGGGGSNVTPSVMAEVLWQRCYCFGGILHFNLTCL